MGCPLLDWTRDWLGARGGRLGAPSVVSESQCISVKEID